MKAGSPVGLTSIPWWAILYILLIVYTALWSAVQGLRTEKRSILHVITDLVSAALLIVLIVGRWNQALVASWGYWAAVVFAGIVTWDVYSTSRDLAETENDPKLPPRVNAIGNWLGILAGAVATAPAYALALMSVVSAWRGAA